MNDASREPRVPLAQLLRDAARELQDSPLPPLRPWRPAANEALRPTGRRRWPWPTAWAAAAACSLLMLVAALLMLGGPADRGEVLAEQAAASEFLPIAPAERWAQLERSGADAAWLVSTELPRDRLAALGLPYDPARAGESVRAELLMHASGEVLAVRFLR